jgi:6-phosphogluconolactonase (cycloisomerase 2 family)
MDVCLNVISSNKPLVVAFIIPSTHRLNVVYTCTKDIEENGRILAYQIHNDGSLTQIGSVDAGGTSTCYLTIDREQRHLIAVNYWDSSLAVIPLSREDGTFLDGVKNLYDPRGGEAVRAAAKKHGGVNHSNNDEGTIAQRQVDPHSHALVLDPFEGCVAYVPDLGKDLVREFWYEKEVGRVACELNALPSGMSTGRPDGPRYFEFHPRFNVAYVVNELSSTVSLMRDDVVFFLFILKCINIFDTPIFISLLSSSQVAVF